MNGNFKNIDERMFKLAREVAETSDFVDFQIGCVLTYRGHVIGKASNTNKTCPQQKAYNRFKKFNLDSGVMPQHKSHAEILALKSVPYQTGQEINWSKVKCYTYRICRGKALGHGMSRPCPACMRALKDYGIRDIFYTSDNGYCYERVDGSQFYKKP